jgi:hypothetical protein
MTCFDTEIILVHFWNDASSTPEWLWIWKEPVRSPRSRCWSSFCPARFYGAAVFFVGEEWTKRTRLERERKWAEFRSAAPIYGKVGTKRGTNSARTLAGQWECRVPRKNRDANGAAPGWQYVYKSVFIKEFVLHRGSRSCMTKEQ